MSRKPLAIARSSFPHDNSGLPTPTPLLLLLLQPTTTRKKPKQQHRHLLLRCVRSRSVRNRFASWNKSKPSLSPLATVVETETTTMYGTVTMRHSAVEPLVSYKSRPTILPESLCRNSKTTTLSIPSAIYSWTIVWVL